VLINPEPAAATGLFTFGPPAPPRRTLVDLLAGPLRHLTDEMALTVVSPEGATQYSYGELDVLSNRLARQLLASGLVLGDTAAVLLPRSVHLVVALLACVKAGIAYCPLEPTPPSARLKHLLLASRARLLITTSAIAGGLGMNIPCLLLDAVETREAIDGRHATPISDDDRMAVLEPNSVAYVIFTSGSTGLPKGVTISHGAIAQQVQATAAELKVQRGQTIVSVTSIAFDPSTLELFLSLSQGFVLVLLDEDIRKDPRRIRDALVTHQAALFLATPSLLRTLPLGSLPTTLTVVSGGEPFPAELLPRMAHLRGVFNAYGPTEAAVTTTMHRLGLQDRGAKVIPIGRPMAGYRVWIVDSSLHPVPIGVMGELCVGGGALASGYVGEPLQTASAFPPSPFGDGRIYRTGDLARWRPDGVIELLGRSDAQVKVLGHRIEPAEVEHVLRTLPWVADAAVQPYGASPHVKLVAYIAPQSPELMPPIADVRALLADQLPKWMVPSEFISLPALPRTATEKLDRGALPQVPAVPAVAFAGRQPQSPDEALLCRLFAQVTGSAAVDVDSDFFEIGGDSLAAMILITELDQIGRELPLTTLLSARTPAAIGAAWSEGAAAVRGTPRPTLFLIPGANGDTPSLAALRVEWIDVLDCVLLDYPEWFHFLAPGFGLDDLVADLARRILDRAPPGPLLLAGYSLGGLVAWSLAKHLANTARPVQVLFVLDTTVGTVVPNAGTSRPFSAVKRSISRIYSLLREFAPLLVPRETPEYQSLLAHFIVECIIKRPVLLRLLEPFRKLHIPPGLRFQIRFNLRWTLYTRTVQAWQIAKGAASVPLDNRCKMVLFRAAVQEQTAPPNLGWQALNTEFLIFEAAGDHLSMLNKRGASSLHKRLPEILGNLLEAAQLENDKDLACVTLIPCPELAAGLEPATSALLPSDWDTGFQ
jgi:amino acid adenylation domain-containing protein